MAKKSPVEVEIQEIKERCRAKVAEILPALANLSPEKKKKAEEFLDEAIKSQQAKVAELGKSNGSVKVFGKKKK